MMEPTHFLDGHDPPRFRCLDGAGVWRVLLQAQVRATPMIIVREVSETVGLAPNKVVAKVGEAVGVHGHPGARYPSLCTLYLGASHLANRFARHLGERGDIPRRKESLLKGETARKHLAIPMFMGR